MSGSYDLLSCFLRITPPATISQLLRFSECGRPRTRLEPPQHRIFRRVLSPRRLRLSTGRLLHHYLLPLSASHAAVWPHAEPARLAPGWRLRTWQIRALAPPHATLLCCSICKPLLARLLVCSEDVSRSTTRHLVLLRHGSLTCYVPFTASPLLAALLPKQNSMPTNARVCTRSLTAPPLLRRLRLAHLPAS
jgi:hypothetical protein